MDVAGRFYRQQLRSSKEAIAYLKKRGLTGETAARFGIGYAPAGWQNLDAAFSGMGTGRRATNLLIKAGLLIRNEDGNCYSRFRDRIMFPILNLKGMLVGFGGRVLEQGEPKYLNSPETPLFQKGRELYNLFNARRAIREAGRVIVVEGYMDVVALSQHGIEYAVATLGHRHHAFPHPKTIAPVPMTWCFVSMGIMRAGKPLGEHWKTALHSLPMARMSVFFFCRKVRIPTAISAISAKRHLRNCPGNPCRYLFFYSGNCRHALISKPAKAAPSWCRRQNRCCQKSQRPGWR